MKHKGTLSLLLIIKTIATNIIKEIKYNDAEVWANFKTSHNDFYIDSETFEEMKTLNSKIVSLNHISDTMIKKYVKMFHKNNNLRYDLMKNFISDYIGIMKKNKCVTIYESKKFIKIFNDFKYETKKLLNQMLMDIICSIKNGELNVEKIILDNFGNLLKAYHKAKMTALMLLYEKELSNKENVLENIRKLKAQYRDNFHKICDEDIENLNMLNSELFLSFKNIKTLFRKLVQPFCE